MSFSSDIKQILCETEYECPCCRTAELAGALGSTGRLEGGIIRFNSSSKAVSERIGKDLSGEFSIDLCGGKILIENETDVKRIKERLETFTAESECCRIAYIRGAFLGGGSVSDPKREYHMEFDTRSEAGAEKLIALLGGFDIRARRTLRKGRIIVYIKESGNIADIIGRMSGGRAGLEVISVQVEKEIKNSIVRLVNCDSANLNKQAKASSKQIAAIKKIKAARKWQSMPEVLREIGELRLRYPDVSMEALGKMTGQQIGKSGVNHRLSRIIEYAESMTVK